MLNYSLSPEQKLLKNSIREFCTKELSKDYVRWMDENVSYPPDELWKKIADIGIFGLETPEKYDGIEMGPIETVIVIEEISKWSSGVALAVTTSLCFGSRPLIALGTEEQKMKYLPKLASGELRWSMALTEPAGGTDILNAMSTTAVKDGDNFIINGQKMFISGADEADYMTILALTDENAPKRSKAISIFIVDTKTPGIEIHKISKVCNHMCSVCEVFLDNVRVPKENILGTLNNGWHELLSTLNPERFYCAAMSLGLSEAIFKDSLQYAKEREAYGRPIGQFMALQHMLADMAVEIEVGRNLVYKCAWLCEQGKPYHVEATMAKLFTAEKSCAHAMNGMEIFGGYGVCMEYDMQRYYRDVRQFPFAPISNEMAKNYIGQSLGLGRCF